MKQKTDTSCKTLTTWQDSAGFFNLLNLHFITYTQSTKSVFLLEFLICPSNNDQCLWVPTFSSMLLFINTFPRYYFYLLIQLNISKQVFSTQTVENNTLY